MDTNSKFSILDIESNFTNWLNLSILLLTAALIFYQIKDNLKFINKPFAGVIASSLIIYNIIFTVNSLFPYYKRTSETQLTDEELTYRNIYLVVSILFLITELLIFISIIVDSLYNL